MATCLTNGLKNSFVSIGPKIIDNSQDTPEILGFKNINIEQWMNAMSKPDTAADELAIFALNEMYGRHTVIYNKARPWSVLDPPYPMTETELHYNCQIHLAYIGKDSYGILC